ncbi:MAG: LPS export ABC transporter permease LptF [Halorhodospira sp.]
MQRARRGIEPTPLLLPIIDRYLVREAAWTALAVLAVLFAVLASNQLIDYLAEAAGGRLPGEAVAVLMGLEILRYLGVVIPAALFLGIVLALGRLYRDSELPVLAACGVGPGRQARGLMLLAVPVAALVGTLAIGVAPWATHTANAYAEQAARSVDLGALQAGRFMGGGKVGTLYASRSEGEGVLGEVFAHAREDGRETVIRADRARQVVDPDTGARFLVFEDGYRYDGRPGRLDWRVTRFDRHGMRVGGGEAGAVEREREGRPLGALWAAGGPADLAEIQWRLSMPVMALVLTLLAVPLAKAEPRDGRYGKLLTAVLVFVAYFQLLTSARGWLEAGTVPAALGLWWVHALGLAAAALWTRRRFGAAPGRRWHRLGGSG